MNKIASRIYIYIYNVPVLFINILYLGKENNDSIHLYAICNICKLIQNFLSVSQKAYGSIVLPCIPSYIVSDRCVIYSGYSIASMYQFPGGHLREVKTQHLYEDNIISPDKQI